jgi:hypothetical protein
MGKVYLESKIQEYEERLEKMKKRKEEKARQRTNALVNKSLASGLNEVN